MLKFSGFANLTSCLERKRGGYAGKAPQNRSFLHGAEQESYTHKKEFTKLLATEASHTKEDALFATKAERRTLTRNNTQPTRKPRVVNAPTGSKYSRH